MGTIFKVVSQCELFELKIPFRIETYRFEMKATELLVIEMFR